MYMYVIDNKLYYILFYSIPTTCRSAFSAPFVVAVVVDDATQCVQPSRTIRVSFCHSSFCDDDTSRKSALHVNKLATTTTLGSLCTNTFVAQCARVKYVCCVVDAIPQPLSFVVVSPYKNFCWLQSANVR